MFLKEDMDSKQWKERADNKPTTRLVRVRPIAQETTGAGRDTGVYAGLGIGRKRDGGGAYGLLIPGEVF